MSIVVPSYGVCPSTPIAAQPTSMEKQPFSFGEAIKALKNHKRVARQGWNGKGMWLRLVIPEGLDMGFENLPYIEMKTVDNKLVPWLASQTDVLAEDWTVVE